MTTNPNEEVIDLTEVLNAKTPEATGRVQYSFDDEAEEQDPEPDQDTDQADPEDHDDDESEDPIRSRAECREDAKLFVETFDGIQEQLFKYMVYPKTVLRKGDTQKVGEYFEKASKTSLVTDDVLLDAYQRWQDFEVACTNLPFKKEEKERLVKPLSKILHKHQTIKMSPEAAFAMVFFVVMLPRLQPVFPKAFGKIDSMFGSVFNIFGGGETE